MNLAQRANVIQAEMDFKVTDKEARMLFLLAPLIKLAAELRASDTMLDKAHCSFLGETIASMVQCIFDEMCAGKSDAVMLAALQVAFEQFIIDFKENRNGRSNR